MYRVLLLGLLVSCARATVLRQDGQTYRLVTTCSSVEQALVRFGRTARRTCPSRYRLSDPAIVHDGISATPFGPQSRLTMTSDLVCDQADTAR